MAEPRPAEREPALQSVLGAPDDESCRTIVRALAALIVCLAHAVHRRTEARELRALVAGFAVVTDSLYTD